MHLTIDPKSSLKQRIAHVDELIKSFRVIIAEYPQHDGYKESLAELEAKRAGLVNQIGKKRA